MATIKYHGARPSIRQRGKWEVLIWDTDDLASNRGSNPYIPAGEPHIDHATVAGIRDSEKEALAAGRARLGMTTGPGIGIRR